MDMKDEIIKKLGEDDISDLPRVYTTSYIQWPFSTIMDGGIPFRSSFTFDMFLEVWTFLFCRKGSYKAQITKHGKDPLFDYYYVSIIYRIADDNPYSKNFNWYIAHIYIPIPDVEQTIMSKILKGSKDDTTYFISNKEAEIMSHDWTVLQDSKQMGAVMPNVR